MSDSAARIVPGRARERAQAVLPDGQILEAVPGTPLVDIVRAARSREREAATPRLASRAPVVAAIVDGRLRELTATLDRDATVVPLSIANTDGMRIYRRSLSFLLVTAATELFPGVEVYIEHSAPTVGGYFCEVRGREPFTQDELRRIEAHMREIADADDPITACEVERDEAIRLVSERGDEELARLLRHRVKGPVRLYTLRGRLDYFQGYMAPSTGCLRHFGLDAFPPGFLLEFPHQASPTEVCAQPPYPKLFSVFEEASHWLDRLGIRGVGALNDAIVEGRLPEISLVAEALHEARIAQIAGEVAAARDRIKLVVIAGPSSSGKTTFSKRLAVQLLAAGIRPFPIGLDDYFVDREATPRTVTGEFDFECLQALDVALFNEHLLSLTAGRPTDLPRYNFLTGRREAGPTITLGPDHLILVEGIHGLNPDLVPGLPAESVYRVYVSALTQLNLDRHNRVSTTDSRLIRRIVRDASSRGYTATDNIRRWDIVTRSEKQMIFAFQENSDAIFNSALVHELSVLRPFAEPLLLQVRPDTPEHLEANRLLSFLQWFRPATPDPVPDNSILREFIGGSVLQTFRLWPTART